jgi:hypothetical protein
MGCRHRWRIRNMVVVAHKSRKPQGFQWVWATSSTGARHKSSNKQFDTAVRKGLASAGSFLRLVAKCAQMQGNSSTPCITLILKGSIVFGVILSYL